MMLMYLGIYMAHGTCRVWNRCNDSVQAVDHDQKLALPGGTQLLASFRLTPCAALHCNQFPADMTGLCGLLPAANAAAGRGSRAPGSFGDDETGHCQVQASTNARRSDPRPKVGVCCPQMHCSGEACPALQLDVDLRAMPISWLCLAMQAA